MRVARMLPVSIVLVAGLLVAVLQPATSGASTDGAHRVTLFESPRGEASGVDLTYTKNTVVIPAAVVAAELLSVSADGSVFTFKNASGPLAALKAGKVMLLQGKAVADVTSAAVAGGHLVVHTSPPGLSDFIQSGTVDVDAPISFAGGTITPMAEPPAQITDSSPEGAAASAADGAPAGSRVGDEALTARALGSIGDLGDAIAAHPATPRSYPLQSGTTYSGSTGGIDYTATINRATDRLDFSVSYTYDKTGMITEIHTTGYLDTFAAHLQMLINNDVAKSSSFLASPLDGHLHMDWTMARGPDAVQTLKVPAFTLPFSFNFPFIIGGIPFFIKIEFQMLITLSLSAKNSTLAGGVDLSYDGSGGGLSASGSMTPQGSEGVSGSFETPQSLTPIASGLVLAVDAPKIDFGIGIASALSGYGYVDLISSLGETTGSLVAGESCEQDDLDFVVKVGTGAEFIKTIPESLLPNKVLYEKKAQYTQPGC
ncbi:MAG TPA: hypothetical protein VMD59_23685 [Acidimicrobiales bacterium]|nr:hypothetical protein [Acidimicrobiales bacterium]